jgi:hypothetical protein
VVLLVSEYVFKTFNLLTLRFWLLNAKRFWALDALHRAKNFGHGSTIHDKRLPLGLKSALDRRATKPILT